MGRPGCFVFFIFTFLFLGNLSFAESYDFEYQKNIDVAGKAELEIINSQGNIKIEGAPVDRITVSAIKHVRATDLAEAEEIADHIEIKAAKSGDQIHIEVRFLKITRASDSFWKKLFGTGPDSFGSVDFQISLPYYCKLDVDNTAGNIYIDNLDNDIRIASASGEIELNGIEGNIDIAGTGANILMRSIQGNSDIRTTTGNVEAQDYFGGIKIKSTSGDITLYQENGNHELATHSGDVRVKTELNSDKEFRVETDTGRIFFSVPAAASGSVKLETISGNINTELPLTVQQFSKNKLAGTFGHRGPKIVIESQSGDITLGQY